jgi:hypothetical protein
MLRKTLNLSPACAEIPAVARNAAPSAAAPTTHDDSLIRVLLPILAASQTVDF